MDIQAIAPAIRIFLLWALTRFATMGYFTPQDASELTKWIMDGLVNGAPIVYGAWAVWNNRRAARVAAVDATKGVAAVITDNSPEGRAIAAAVPSPTVAPAAVNPGVKP